MPIHARLSGIAFARNHLTYQFTALISHLGCTIFIHESKMILKGLAGKVILGGGERKLMKKTVFGLTVAGVLLLAPLSPVAATTLIEYQVLDLPNTSAGDVWQYQYQVSQFDFPKNWGFDIFFLLGQGYQPGDLLESLSPNHDWDVLLLKPDPGLPDDSRYDAVALINSPSLSSCFTQTIIWRGTGTPGRQPFEIFDASYKVIESGQTEAATFTCPAVVETPEPSLLWLLGAGLLGLAWSRPKPSRSGTGRARHAPGNSEK